MQLHQWRSHASSSIAPGLQEVERDAHERLVAAAPLFGHGRQARGERRAGGTGLRCLPPRPVILRHSKPAVCQIPTTCQAGIA